MVGTPGGARARHRSLRGQVDPGVPLRIPLRSSRWSPTARSPSRPRSSAVGMSMRSYSSAGRAPWLQRHRARPPDEPTSTARPRVDGPVRERVVAASTPLPRAISRRLTGYAAPPASHGRDRGCPRRADRPRPASSAPGTSSTISVSTISIVAIESVSEANASGATCADRHARAHERQAREPVAEREREQDRGDDVAPLLQPERGAEHHAEHLAERAAA